MYRLSSYGSKTHRMTHEETEVVETVYSLMVVFYGKSSGRLTFEKASLYNNNRALVQRQHSKSSYEVALMSRLLTIIGLFCKRAL